MTERIIIAGAGGQGIMLLGKVIAEIAMRQGKFVTWLPSYGAEVRGGTAHCIVVISDEEIGSPYVEQADTLIIMNGPSLNKFFNYLKKDGLLVVNSTLAKVDKKYLAGSRKIFSYPFSDLAVKAGNVKTANMMALGCYAQAKKGLIEQNVVFKIFSDFAPKGREDIVLSNRKAFQEGINLYGDKSTFRA